MTTGVLSPWVCQEAALSDVTSRTLQALCALVPIIHLRTLSSSGDHVSSERSDSLLKYRSLFAYGWMRPIIALLI